MPFELPSTILPVRSVRDSSTLGYHQEFLHRDGNWSNSRNREKAAEEYRQTAENKITDKINIKLAHQYNYSKFPHKPPNGYNPKTGMARGWTPTQVQEWKEMHAHCGGMHDSTRASIMREMQQEAGVVPEDFHDYVEMLEYDFAQRGYVLDTPESLSEMPFYMQQKYFNAHRLPSNVSMEPPRRPAGFWLMDSEQQDEWHVENGNPPVFATRPISRYAR
ncbi:hypothetical protein T484DRAFT_1755542 [Baffinella frigidus]|nr:hypothetical protein T484DRAFT_1755542 [Cryptophyta sp. CCMP2293]